MLAKLFKKKSSTKGKSDKTASQTLAAPLNTSIPTSVSSYAVPSGRTPQNLADTRQFSRTTADVTSAGDDTDDELESGVSDDENDFYTCAAQASDDLFPDYASVTLVRRSAMNALKQSDDNDPTARHNQKTPAKQRPADRMMDLRPKSKSNAASPDAVQKTEIVGEVKVKGSGKEAFELAILRAVHDESHDILIERHLFVSFSIDKPTFCDECSEHIWGISSPVLCCSYCRLTVHPGCAPRVQYRCPLSHIEEDLPKLGESDVHTLTLRRVPKGNPSQTIKTEERANGEPDDNKGEVVLRKAHDKNPRLLEFSYSAEVQSAKAGQLAVAVAGVTLSESSCDAEMSMSAGPASKSPNKSARHADAADTTDDAEQFYTAQSDELRAAAAGASSHDGDCYIVEDSGMALTRALSPSASMLSDSELCPFPSLLDFNPLTGPPASGAHSNTNSSNDSSLTGDDRPDSNASPKHPMRTFARSSADEPVASPKRQPEPTTPTASRALSAVPHYAFSTLDTQSIKRFEIRITELRGAPYNTMSAVGTSSVDSGIGSHLSHTVKPVGSREASSSDRLFASDVSTGVGVRTGSSTSSTMTGSCSTVVHCAPGGPESADWLATVSRDRLTQLLNIYNSNMLGFSAQCVSLPNANVAERQVLVAGFVRVYVNLIRPIKLNLSARPTTIYDLVESLPNGQNQSGTPSPDASHKPNRRSLVGVSGNAGDSAELRLSDCGSLTTGGTQRERRTYRSSRTATDKLSTFYLPRGTMKVLHIGSRTTTYDVISCLLNKFHIRDNPRKFALYEHTVEGPHDVTIRKFLDGECPLVTCLQWADLDAPKPLDAFHCTLQKKRLVIQENESGDVDWEAFSIPELNNFLAILQREEDQRRREITKKYKLARKQALKRLRQLEKRQTAVAAATS